MENALRESEKSISKANQLREDQLRSTTWIQLDRWIECWQLEKPPLDFIGMLGIHGNSWQFMHLTSCHTVDAC